MQKLTVDAGVAAITTTSAVNNPEEEKKGDAAASAPIYRSMGMVANKNTV